MIEKMEKELRDKWNVSSKKKLSFKKKGTKRIYNAPKDTQRGRGGKQWPGEKS